MDIDREGVWLGRIGDREEGKGLEGEAEGVIIGVGGVRNISEKELESVRGDITRGEGVV